MKLTSQSIHEEVKLGMIILVFFENNIARQILKTLGLHSTFTIYALEATKNFICYNQFVHELAPNTCSYGKIAALHRLEPISFQYLNHVLPEEVLEENPNEIKDNEITYEYKPDMWVIYLLKALRRGKDYEEDLFIRCLTARFPDVLIEAICV